MEESIYVILALYTEWGPPLVVAIEYDDVTFVRPRDSCRNTKSCLAYCLLAQR